MWFRTRRAISRISANSSRQLRYRPRLEALEDRSLPSAGAFDLTFGNGAGYVITSLTNGPDLGQTALIQPDGKIIATGRIRTSFSGPFGFGAARYNTDGSLDSSFGSGGTAVVSFNFGNPLPWRSALYPQAGTANDGKIVMFGDVGGQLALARLNVNGTLDTTFGTGGTVTTSFSAGTFGLESGGVVVTGAGQIVAGGLAGSAFVLARYNNDGSLDNTFGSGGEVTTTSAQFPTLNPIEVLQQADGKLLEVGDASGSAGHDWLLVRYNADGSLDTSFGNQGIATAPFNGSWAMNAALYPNTGTPNGGKIVLVGDNGNGLDQWQAVRFNTDGSLDTSFGNNGLAVTPQYNSSVWGVAVDANGQILMSGSGAVAPPNTYSYSFLERLNPDGTPDSSFGSGGLVTPPVGIGGVAVYPNAGTANDGKIVTVGANKDSSNKPDFAVARYLGDSTTLAVAGFPSPDTAGIAGNFAVTVHNASGGTNTGYTGTVHFTSSDGQAVLPGDYTFTAGDQGVHTFSAILKTAGSQSLTAADTTNGFQGSETGIAVNPAAASTLSVAGYPSPTNVGVAGSFAVTAVDSFGNKATGYTGTVQFTSSDPLASLPANYTFAAADHGAHTFSATLNTTGTQSLTATDITTAGITGSQTGITVNPAAAPASTLNVTGFPSPTTAGVAGTITVTARDTNGYVAAGYRGTVHFTSSDPQAVLPANYTFTSSDQGVHTFSVTLKTAGSKSVTATDTVTGSITGSEAGITITPAAASQLLLGAPSSVTHGAAFSLTLTVEDAYGNVVNGYRGTVHFTSSDSTATLPGNYTFTAADAGVHTLVNKTILRKRGTKTVTVTDTLNSALTATDGINVL